MENPLVEAVRKAGLTRAELARRAGLSYATVSQAMAGYPKTPPEAVLQVLESLGWDAEELERRYVGWRNAYRDREGSAAAGEKRGSRGGEGIEPKGGSTP